MANSSTKEKIKKAIYGLARTGPGRAKAPVTTAQEIADELGVSKQTVLNHVDEIVESDPHIHKDVVAGANVYFKADSRNLDEISTEKTRVIGQLPYGHPDQAEFYEVRVVTDSSDCDFEVRWYDSNLEELPQYEPTRSELGHVVHAIPEQDLNILFNPIEANETKEGDE